MKLRDYAADRWVQAVIAGVFLLAGIAFGILVGIPGFYLWFVFGMSAAAFLFSGIYDYMRKREFYESMKRNGENLDKAYLLPELMEQPDFLEGKAMYGAMKIMERSMAEQVGSYEKNSREYKEFIELWVHEIKLPIATGKLLVENHREAYGESMLEELDKIEAYTEQALFYARSNYVEKDYVLKKVSLKQLTSEVIRKNKKGLLDGRVTLDLHDLDAEVYSDGKWLAFILQQILSNSMKYMGEGERRLEWYARKSHEQVKLYLRDTGIGIPAKDLPRIFEKGFTGENGRSGKKSTGIGLYLCKKLCEKMGHKIQAVSSEGRGCTMVICFPVGSMHGELFFSEPYKSERKV